jgi:hypothetical protein
MTVSKIASCRGSLDDTWNVVLEFIQRGGYTILSQNDRSRLVKYEVTKPGRATIVVKIDVDRASDGSTLKMQVSPKKKSDSIDDAEGNELLNAVLIILEARFPEKVLPSFKAEPSPPLPSPVSLPSPAPLIVHYPPKLSLSPVPSPPEPPAPKPAPLHLKLEKVPPITQEAALRELPNRVEAPKKEERERVLDFASRHSFRYLMTRRSFRSSVTSVEKSIEAYSRALRLIEHRTIELRMASASSAALRGLAPMPSPTGLKTGKHYGCDSRYFPRPRLRLVRVCNW